jgi:hypothetical protein
VAVISCPGGKTVYSIVYTGETEDQTWRMTETKRDIKNEKGTGKFIPGLIQQSTVQMKRMEEWRYGFVVILGARWR